MFMDIEIMINTKVMQQVHNSFFCSLLRHGFSTENEWLISLKIHRVKIQFYQVLLCTVITASDFINDYGQFLDSSCIFSYYFLVDCDILQPCKWMRCLEDPISFRIIYASLGIDNFEYAVRINVNFIVIITGYSARYRRSCAASCNIYPTYCIQISSQLCSGYYSYYPNDIHIFFVTVIWLTCIHILPHYSHFLHTECAIVSNLLKQDPDLNAVFWLNMYSTERF